MNGGDNLGLKGTALNDCDSFGHTLPREIAFQRTQDVAGGQRMFAKTATGLNGDELFRLPCIPNAPRCRDGRPASECPYLENGATTDPRKMVSQHQNVQVHHGLALTELFQVSMNRLV